MAAVEERARRIDPWFELDTLILTAEDVKRCRWLKPQPVAAIEFLEMDSR